MIPYLLAQCGTGVVDRVEGEIAIVEWCGSVFFDVPLRAVDGRLVEGAELRLTVIEVQPTRPTTQPRGAAGRGVGRRDARARLARPGDRS